MDIKADAECQLNKSEANIIQVCHESGMLYFRPETEEIIVVPAEDAGDFETHCLEMLGRVDEFHQANHAYSVAVEKYGLQRQQAGVDIDSLVAEVVAAETSLEKKSGRRYWKNSGMEKPAIWGIRKWWNCFRYSILAEGEPGISDWGGVMSMPTKVIILNVPGAFSDRG
ncbi:hypothetical protein O5903_23900 [Escherichia coli]|nr:hypothetical protein [Escherichia coli]